jgi:hypothetical protein
MTELETYQVDGHNVLSKHVELEGIKGLQIITKKRNFVTPCLLLSLLKKKMVILLVEQTFCLHSVTERYHMFLIL